jgi:hypothetical protein
LKQRLTIILAAFLLLGNAALAELPANPQGYALPFYTIMGTVTKDGGGVVENLKIEFYKAGDPDPERKITADINPVDGTYSLNAYELYFKDGVEIKLDGVTEYVLNVPDGGKGWSGSNTIKLTNTQGYMVEDVLLIKTESGPQINLTVLLQGLYDASTHKQNTTNATILVEARVVPAGVDIATNATKIIGSATFNLNEDGYGTGAFVGLTPGDYYIVVKQKLNDVPAGMSHLPIITSKKLPLNATTPLTLDLSSGVDVYNEEVLGNFPAMASVGGGKKAMWAGDMDGDGRVNVVDVGQAWFYLFTEFNKKTPKSSLDPSFPTYQIADLDGNTLVNVIDVGNPWFSAFSVLKNYNGKTHTYVPVAVP